MCLQNTNPFDVLFKTFPAGTLSGAPKYKAMQLINEYEPTAAVFMAAPLALWVSMRRATMPS